MNMVNGEVFLLTFVFELLPFKFEFHGLHGKSKNYGRTDRFDELQKLKIKLVQIYQTKTFLFQKCHYHLPVEIC